MRYALTTFLLSLLFPAYVHAQDCGGIPDQTTDPDNACRLCNRGVFEYLPENTDCGTEPSECYKGELGEGVYRDQCIAGAVANQTVCENVFKGPCPGGNVCMDGTTCGTTCMDQGDCRAGFRCGMDGFCERIPAPEPDAGGDVGPTDAGSTDVGSADMDSVDVGGADLGQPADDVSSVDTDGAGVKGSKGCSCAAGAGRLDGAVLLLFAFLGLTRRKRR